MKYLKQLKTNTFSKPQLAIFAIVFALIGFLIYKSFAAPNPNLPGDLNGDNTVNVTDMSILLSNYGTSNSTADINGDGTVNVLDLSALLSHYGQSYTSGQLAKLEAEAMNPPSSTNGGIISDPTASGGQARSIWANGTATGSFTLSAPAGSLTVVADGTNCASLSKYPALTVSIDGSNVGSATVTATSWTTYSFNSSIAAGTHTLGLAMSGDYSQTGVCDVNLNLDVTTFFAASSTSPPPTTTLNWFASTAWPNLTIPANPTISPNSATWIQMLYNAATNGVFANGLSNLGGQWSTTVYHVHNSDPVRRITMAYNFPIGPNNTPQGYVDINYRSGMVPTPDTDGHMVVINDDTGLITEFQGLNQAVTATMAADQRYLITGDAVYDPTQHVAGLLLPAGLIRPEDISAGVIDHAVRGAITATASSYVWPAVHSDGKTTGGIPMGSLLWLPRSVDLSSYGLNQYQLMLAKAIQEHGFYASDTTSNEISVQYQSVYSNNASYPFSSMTLPRSLILQMKVLTPLGP